MDALPLGRLERRQPDTLPLPWIERYRLPDASGLRRFLAGHHRLLSHRERFERDRQCLEERFTAYQVR
jgi:hypothetical protein